MNPSYKSLWFLPKCKWAINIVKYKLCLHIFSWWAGKSLFPLQFFGGNNIIWHKFFLTGYFFLLNFWLNPVMAINVGKLVLLSPNWVWVFKLLTPLSFWINHFCKHFNVVWKAHWFGHTEVDPRCKSLKLNCGVLSKIPKKKLFSVIIPHKHLFWLNHNLYLENHNFLEFLLLNSWHIVKVDKCVPQILVYELWW